MNYTLANLQARCDGGQFALSVISPTPYAAGMDPNQPSFPTKGSGTARVAISFAYVYRTRRVQSQLLVVPTALSAAAQQKMLNDAWASLDLLDARVGTLGAPIPLVP